MPLSRFLTVLLLAALVGVAAGWFPARFGFDSGKARAAPGFSPRLALSTTVSISPSVVVQIYGGGTNYQDAVNGNPFTIGEGDLVARAAGVRPAAIEAEAAQCDRNSLPPPSFRVRRAFIEYDTSMITRTVTGARLIFSNYRPFEHDGSGVAVHDLMIHAGKWTSTADITPTIVASTTFRAWSETLLATINFGSVTVYPYLASLAIDPETVVLSGTTRLVFRTSAENRVGPVAASCDRDGSAGSNAIGNAFIAPLLQLHLKNEARTYLPLIVKLR